LQDDITAFTPISTVGPSAGDEFFAPETNASAAAVSGLYGYRGFIDEFHTA
jgi:hypothetical protein